MAKSKRKTETQRRNDVSAVLARYNAESGAVIRQHVAIADQLLRQRTLDPQDVAMWRLDAEAIVARVFGASSPQRESVAELGRPVQIAHPGIVPDPCRHALGVEREHLQALAEAWTMPSAAPREWLLPARVYLVQVCADEEADAVLVFLEAVQLECFLVEGGLDALRRALSRYDGFHRVHVVLAQGQGARMSNPSDQRALQLLQRLTTCVSEPHALRGTVLEHLCHLDMDVSGWRYRLARQLVIAGVMDSVSAT